MSEHKLQCANCRAWMDYITDVFTPQNGEFVKFAELYKCPPCGLMALNPVVEELEFEREEEDGDESA